jgi:hypothetical protein
MIGEMDELRNRLIKQLERDKAKKEAMQQKLRANLLKEKQQIEGLLDSMEKKQVHEHERERLRQRELELRPPKPGSLKRLSPIEGGYEVTPPKASESSREEWLRSASHPLQIQRAAGTKERLLAQDQRQQNIFHLKP